MKRALVALAALLAGCAHPDPPLLTLTGRSCDAAPSLSDALPVPFDTRAGASAKLGATSPCLQTDGGRTVTYAVFRLPDAPHPYQITVRSELTGHAVVRPRITVYGDSGAVLRTVPATDFRANVDGYTAGLRSDPADRLLVVAADPASIGEPTTLRLSIRDVGPQIAATVFVPVIVATPVYEQQREHEATLSLNGTVRVSAAPIAVVR